MFWVSGLVVGVVLVERWRRTGGLLPTPDSVDDAGETVRDERGSGGCRRKQKLPTVLVAGPKADLIHRPAPHHPNGAARGSPLPVMGRAPAPEPAFQPPPSRLEPRLERRTPSAAAWLVGVALGQEVGAPLGLVGLTDRGGLARPGPGASAGSPGSPGCTTARTPSPPPGPATGRARGDPDPEAGVGLHLVVSEVAEGGPAHEAGKRAATGRPCPGAPPRARPARPRGRRVTRPARRRARSSPGPEVDRFTGLASDTTRCYGPGPVIFLNQARNPLQVSGFLA